MTAEALEVVERLLEAFDRVDLHRPSRLWASLN